MSIGNERTTYLRGLEVAELKEEDMPMVISNQFKVKQEKVRLLHTK